MRKSAFLTILLGGVVLFTGMAAATVRHVPSQYATIQAAIDACNNGDTVIVDDGTYTGTGDKDLDFGGKAITVESENGPANCIIDCQGSGRGFYFHSGENLYSVLDGFTIINGDVGYSGGGIYCDGASPTIINNIIANNTALSSTITPSSRGGGICCVNSSAFIVNNLIVGNYVRGLGGGIYTDSCRIINNTITENNSEAASFESCVGGIYCTGSSLVANTIIWGNTGHHSTEQISGCSNVIYSNIQDGYEGLGNINLDPFFADPGNGDYHLKSTAGRWDPDSESWVTDTVTSPCIDAGNPGCSLGDEPSSTYNVRVNMGAYGGTVKASKTPADWRSIADLTNDWAMDFNDLGVFVSYWLDSGECIPSDLNRNQLVNFDDYVIFALEWPGAVLAAEPGVEYEITPCDMVMSIREQLDDTRFTVTVEGRRILFEDMMVANCCTPIQNLWIEMTVNGLLITITENEELPQHPCLCICDYPVTATLGPFEPGIYTIEVYEDWGGFIGSATVNIE